MALWTLAAKDLRLLLRDRRSAVILLAMPLIFILVLGLSLGEGFGQKQDERLRVSIVKLDHGDLRLRCQYAGAAYAMQGSLDSLLGSLAWQRVTDLRSGSGKDWPHPERMQYAAAPYAMHGSLDSFLGSVAWLHLTRQRGEEKAREWPLREPWVEAVQRDLAETAGIKVEIIPTLEEAEALVRDGQRPAIIVFQPTFSEKVTSCSFLADGINPFYRDGIKLEEVDVQLLSDRTQPISAAIIEQVTQVSLMRVVLPWMIGRAFEKLSEPTFMTMLADEVPAARFLTPSIKAQLGAGVQGALSRFFPKYNLTGKTWAALTKSDPKLGGGAGTAAYSQDGTGLLRRGSVRYQTLVPSYTVMFAFFLVLTVGWLFVAERRQGTLKRLRVAPLSRTEILLGKLLPCLVVSLGQGLFLLGMGRLLFGMSWGPQPWWLLLVAATTSLAAMGLALLVASLARTESQVAVYGTLLVLVLAGVSGSMMERDKMPEAMKQVSRLTPHAWALDAYAQLLQRPEPGQEAEPNLKIVGTSCLVLTGFGLGFISLAWWVLKLE
jgi:ABC-type transport system involved in multi-copper enzyme maturation permease subunit